MSDFAPHRRPSEPTRPEHWRVIFWASIAVLVIAGCVGLWFSLDPPAGKAGVAAALRRLSLICFAAAAGLYAIRRLVGVLMR